MELLKKAGLELSGVSPDKELVEIVELKDHPWFLGCQFHPEFRSKPMDPHPLFREFIKASLRYGAGSKFKAKRSKGKVRSLKKKDESPAQSAKGVE
jgi:hypothetical protein